MKLLKSLMGRREFLIAAGVTSTSALALDKLAMGTNSAMAADKPADAAKVSGGASNTIKQGNRYPHLLSPLQIGNVVLKNRMMQTRSHLHFMQGPENYPPEIAIAYYAGVARSSAIVTFRHETLPLRERKNLRGDSAHMPLWDVYDAGVQNYIAQAADACHFYNTKVNLGLKMPEPSGYTISNAPMPEARGPKAASKEIPVELMKQMIDEAVKQVVLFQGLGFDGVNIYMAYRAHLLAHALSPALNIRTDKYGGSIENRARFPLELFQAIKKACGQDFLVEAQISGEEIQGGYTIEDLIQYLKIFEGSLDIVQVRGTDASDSHPNGYNSQKGDPKTIHFAEAIKKSGVKIVTAPIGGYGDPALNEDYIASGKTDMIAMARAYICDPEYGKKVHEGRGEDIVPCILCNKCHGLSSLGMWLDVCSVNPKIGIMNRVSYMVDAPGSSKKVAVIGGGPAGMKAALTAAERGHKVTLYEKDGSLGGLLQLSDYSSYRWPLKDYKDYLIRQVKKAGIEVLLKTSATPEMIKAKGYDAVIVALGTDPIIPKIPGVDSKNVWNIVNVYPNKKALGKNVVFIGGGEFGVSTAGSLARDGYKVTLLTSGKELLAETGPHQMSMITEVITKLENFKYITGAIATGISAGAVTYADAGGSEKSIQADSVIIYSGLKPRKSEALKFYGSANDFFIIGDCLEPGNVQTCTRSAFAAASQI